MEGRPSGPSPALLAAQRRLDQLRLQYATHHHGARRAPAAFPAPSATNHQLPVTSYQPPATSYQLPATNPQTPLPKPRYPSISLHPSLALAMLQKEQAAAGRLWLLLRHIDKPGRGWLSLDTARASLNNPGSDLHLCGRRQLRNLLRQGGGLFWQVNHGAGANGETRIWLRSAARVAAGLGVKRLKGRPVTIPIEVLLGGMGQVRAHFYASFHSGRAGADGVAGAPISRQCIARLTRVPARTQRAYEKKAGIITRANLALGPLYSQGQAQERAWRHGRGAFRFTDRLGRQGPAGRRYVAWRLPNSYQGCHAPASKGRQKKINQQIDLVTNRAQGNGRVDRLFHPTGQAAGKAYNRDGKIDAYWTEGWPGQGRTAIWQVIPGRGKAR